MMTIGGKGGGAVAKILGNKYPHFDSIDCEGRSDEKKIYHVYKYPNLKILHFEE